MTPVSAAESRQKPWYIGVKHTNSYFLVQKNVSGCGRILPKSGKSALRGQMYLKNAQNNLTNESEVSMISNMGAKPVWRAQK